ncbi:hypothetical protein GYMLUDRAFT_965986 [Collybiopsis luxurians FD-317 M1]|uniref:Uncharacterized protein n=1 Tax=Collybiopsis luxurians FD-317 M1 TaxID=944289 RepID=A0A0D0C3S5_9AGAR|nr:hypothetical protein GYMLUDRAFT_965986 [Collybiopsis luxurians FD-317 M1]
MLIGKVCSFLSLLERCYLVNPKAARALPVRMESLSVMHTGPLSKTTLEPPLCHCQCRVIRCAFPVPLVHRLLRSNALVLDRYIRQLVPLDRITAPTLTNLSNLASTVSSLEPAFSNSLSLFSERSYLGNAVLLLIPSRERLNDIK